MNRIPVSVLRILLHSSAQSAGSVFGVIWAVAESKYYSGFMIFSPVGFSSWLLRISICYFLRRSAHLSCRVKFGKPVALASLV
ncbi:hypothetical protein V8F20_002022 [Naviculisporaceae sp. PSN 640]